MAVRHVIKRATNGLLNSTVDLLLFQIALFGASFGKSRSPQGVNKMFQEAFSEMEKVNHNTIRTAWQRLRRRGLVSVVDETLYYRPVVTIIGKKRLKQLIPSYQKLRPWDKRIYIITYDIPEKRRIERNRFRDFLKTIGVVFLQQSVWITPYNPRSLIDEFIREHAITGTVIISDTGTNGTIGRESIEDVIIRVYNLEELNNRYNYFLTSYKKLSPQEAVFDYFAILAVDPQLPFSLLPSWWRGDEAYEIYQNLCKTKGDGKKC